jgi:uncharacterized YccA/Bax inhibitor family protein
MRRSMTMNSSNPVLNQKMFQGQAVVASQDGVMTLEGTINKSIISVLLVMAAAYWSYQSPAVSMPLLIPCVIVGLILAIIISVKQTLAPVLTPVYAIAEGLVLGALSLSYASLTAGSASGSFDAPLGLNHELVFQAIALTFGTLFSMLVIYRSGLIKVTDRLKMIIYTATGGIFLLYFITMIMGFFGGQMPLIHESGPLGIGISLVIVGLAAFNLLLDFDFIVKASSSGSLPKYMEWYGAFGLLVTLVWLYMEILRLLAKLARNRD